MPTLSQYILETRRLLHDGTGQYWTDSELTDYINEGRERVVCDTGVNRVIQTIFLSAGLEAYTYGTVTGVDVSSNAVSNVNWFDGLGDFVSWQDGVNATVTWLSGISGGENYSSSTFVTISGGGGTGATAVPVINGSGTIVGINVTNGGMGYTSAPTVTITDPGGGFGASGVASIISLNTLDILNISVIWGTQRIVMDYLAWTNFNARMRVWQQILSRPGVWSSYGQNTFYLGPIPDQFYVAELDSVMLPYTLVNPTDIDTLNYPWSSPVAFYASYKAKIKEQSYSEAENFRGQYIQKAQEALRATYTRRLPSAYQNSSF